MLHPSFRTTLVTSFLLIACILGAAAANGWLSLERFSRVSREGSRVALDLTAAVQQLGERTVDMERSARQFLVLGDPLLLQRFDATHGQAVSALAALERSLPDIASVAADWRSLARSARGAMDEGGGLSSTQISLALSRLVDLNDRLAVRVRQDIERHNTELLDALDRGRERLAVQLAAALATALALAALAGWWVLRPLQRVERAIADLGDSRFDTPISVGGPADLRQLGQRLDWLRQRLVALEAGRHRVLRHVSHELKTPLASLREGIALLRDGVVGPLGDEQREVTAIVEQNAHLLQARIEQLLDFNTVQFDATRLERHAVDLRQLAEKIAAAQLLQAQAKAIRLSVTGVDVTLVADAGKLETALSNVLANAIAFAPPASEVRIVLGTNPDGVIIDCVDEGPGVVADEAERIFEPFFQGSVRAQRPCKGNGLGLAIVRELVAAHGGRIAALPTPRGAHFRMELPRGC
jgi:two-component system sensor histidine kinase GlrK